MRQDGQALQRPKVASRRYIEIAGVTLWQDEKTERLRVVRIDLAGGIPMMLIGQGFDPISLKDAQLYQFDKLVSDTLEFDAFVQGIERTLADICTTKLNLTFNLQTGMQVALTVMFGDVLPDVVQHEPIGTGLVFADLGKNIIVEKIDERGSVFPWLKKYGHNPKDFEGAKLVSILSRRENDAFPIKDANAANRALMAYEETMDTLWITLRGKHTSCMVELLPTSPGKLEHTDASVLGGQRLYSFL
jgi:hypothetical protein